MAKKPTDNSGQVDLFNDWLVDDAPPPAHVEVELTLEEPRYLLALRLAQKLNNDGDISLKFLTDEASRVFGGTQTEGTYSTKDAYDALEAAFNIHLLGTEVANWTEQNADAAREKVIDLTNRIQRLPTQTRRDDEMEEFQQFSTPPALSFVANWVANVKPDDVVCEPSAGTGDLAIWSKMVGAKLVLNELSPRRQTLLSSLFPEATLFKENAEQLDNILPSDIKPTVMVLNPPFSSSAGRVQGQRDTNNGARHIEQALKRLEPRGRLVAIVGKGMAADRPAFTAWWEDIKKKYNVRANIGISGKEYAKYGTTFDNQILVIDKNGATTQPVLTGKVESVADLPLLLESIRNERQHIQSTSVKPAVSHDTQSKPDTLQSGDGTGGVSVGEDGAGTQPIGNRGDSGAIVTDSQTSGTTPVGDGVNDGVGAGDGVRANPIRDVGGSGGGDTGGNSGVTKSDSPRSIVIESKSGEVTEFTDSVFANYTPQRLTISGAQQHPGKLVQSAAMSAVEPPAPTYSPVLPANVISDGLLSIAQLESIVYAGQAHSETLPNGSRKGFFIGDGTGVGKGREISGIILDNMMQGRKKAVWVSFNEGLIGDAKRDFAGIGGDPSKLFFQGKTKAGNEITQKDGILFTTYSTLRGGEKKQANDLGQKSGKSRAQQIIDWLGNDFDGVIAFDEAHSMGNAIAVRGKRGVKKPSQQAIAGINLQRELPNARVTYVSATGATEISNLSYADRLGLWGEGTPFADVNTFIGEVSKGGIASMELISRDMKAMGLYLARSLSYDGVSYERLEHTLSDLQEAIYNELAGAWQVVLSHVDQALEFTQAGKSGPGKSAAMAQFWGAHQRFFNQVVTAMQTPAVIDHIHDQLDAGHVAVIQLVNTNEAAQERIIADATANDAALEELDFTPRQMLMDYVRNGFPVAAYEETQDENGNTTYVPVRDSEGKPVFDRDAIALRDSLLETLQQIRVPENPLDSIINAFGSDRVAEVTGRGRRFVQIRDAEGHLKVVEEKRGKNSSRADAEAFQANKKDILIFSGAGGTGYSFHADNTAANQRKRIHYILQPGWRADAAVQGFGRTHRTNQAQPPHYVLPTTNLKAQKRFVSSIARRLDQLGALTRGQREASSQGMFTASDNLESQYASTALNNFFSDLYRGKTRLSFHDVTEQMGLNLIDDNGSLKETHRPAIPQFLNRLLSLKTDMQNQVFGEFEKRLVEAVDYAKQRGLYDVGLQTMKAMSIQKMRDDVAYEDHKTGAQTRYVELAVTHEVEYHPWDDVHKFVKDNPKEGDLSGWFVSEFGDSKGSVFYLGDIGERLDSDGNSVRRGVIHTIKADGYRYIDNADVISRGYDYKQVGGTYQKVDLTRKIDQAEAEKLWNEQLTKAPKTVTKTGRMLVGVILPIWDRVEGAETIHRLQTDDGEQLLGRMLGAKSAKQTLKNLGLDSGLSGLSASDLFDSIKKGNKAILSNGWEIFIAKVNYEDRIEIKGRSYFTDAEKRLLKEQGAFVERINWMDRVFIPAGESGVGVFERITASKPVVDLFEKSRNKDSTDDEGDQIQDYGVPDAISTTDAINEVGIVNARTGDSAPNNIDNEPNNRQEVISMENAKKPFHEKVAEKLIEQLKQGTAPWQKPWTPGEPSAFSPINPTTGKRYRGINALILMSEDRSDQRWLTYKQAAAAGAQVMKGEKGTAIQYWKFTEEQTLKDEHGKPKLDENGEKITISVKLERPRVFSATVFNAEQIEGLPPPQPPKEQQWSAVERAEKILQASGAVIRHSVQDTAFYRPSTDSIHLPEKNQFESADRFYATALHECCHWSGHSSRLDRDLSHPFGSEGYSKEELRAEIASMLLGDQLGIGHDPGQHAAYVKSWVSVLQNDSFEIFRAAADAEKIQDYILGFEQVNIQEQTDQQVQGLPEVLINRETDMPIPQHNETSLTAYQIELSRLLTQSTLTPGVYEPNETAKSHHHAAVFAGEAAIILCGPSDDRVAVAQAKALAESPCLHEFYRSYGNRDEITSGIIGADQIPWHLTETAIYRKMPVNENADNDHPAIVLNDPRQDIANFLCVTTETARIFDPDVPELDNGKVLSALAGIHNEEMELILRNRSLEQRTDSYPDKAKRLEHLVSEMAAAKALVKTGKTLAEKIELKNVVKKLEDALYELKLNWFEDNARQTSATNTEKTIISVPFKEKDEAKALGAKWGRQEKSWYVPAGVPLAPFAHWRQETTEPESALNTLDKTATTHATQEKEVLETARFWRLNTLAAYRGVNLTESMAQDPEHYDWIINAKKEIKELEAKEKAVKERYNRILNNQKQRATKNSLVQERIYLAVPYAERFAAKELGALWDKEAKSWYIGPNGDKAKLERWKPDNIPHQQVPAMRPEEEFSEALQSLGCVVSGEHPMMDGKTHRITVNDDKGHEKSGFYVAHLDGHPAGYIKNNRTGVEMKWKSKGYSLSPEEKAHLQAEAASKLLEREKALEAKQKAVATDITALLQISEAAPANHPYLLSKQARAGGLLIVPAASSVLPESSNILIGKDWKDSSNLRKDNPEKLVFTEGDLLVPAYDVNGAVWSAQTIQSSGMKMFAKDSLKQGNFNVVGGDLGALVDVPAIVISEGYATADSLSKHIGFPTVSAFDSGNLEMVTKALHEKYPEKPIVIAGDDDKHLEDNPGRTKAIEAATAVGGKAIFPIFAPGEYAADPKKFSDFNDLATKSILGVEGLKRQVCPVIDQVIEGPIKRDQQQEIVKIIAEKQPELEPIKQAKVAGRRR